MSRGLARKKLKDITKAWRLVQQGKKKSTRKINDFLKGKDDRRMTK